jgi:hypothetical protein
MVKEARHLVTLFGGKTECIGAKEGAEIQIP